jgi:two-component system chemotaxis response regulator CheB
MPGALTALPMRGERAAVRVLIVDDSALVRRILTEALSRHDDIEVVGTAADPYIARERIVELRPDVITLDIEMPRMDGLSFLAKMMQHFPLPVVIVSSLTPRHSETALRALALGAVEVIAKPGSAMATADVGEQLARAVRVASVARVVRRTSAETSAAVLARYVAADAGPALVALGASTGGAAALETVLRRFPADAPATVIVQHMPEGFTASFARRLDGLCAMQVKEAAGGEVLVPGLALVAPGGKHLVVQRVGANLVASVKDGPRVHHQRPAVDVLFQSVARAAGPTAAAALLTGMGSDGARGMLAMRAAGAFTVAQDEETCVVYGMPREAVALGAAVESLPLEHIAEALLSGRGAV